VLQLSAAAGLLIFAGVFLRKYVARAQRRH
jgi:hypothetical protein